MKNRSMAIAVTSVATLFAVLGVFSQGSHARVAQYEKEPTFDSDGRFKLDKDNPPWFEVPINDVAPYKLTLVFKQKVEDPVSGNTVDSIGYFDYPGTFDSIAERSIEGLKAHRAIFEKGSFNVWTPESPVLNSAHKKRGEPYDVELETVQCFVNEKSTEATLWIPLKPERTNVEGKAQGYNLPVATTSYEAARHYCHELSRMKVALQGKGKLLAVGMKDGKVQVEGMSGQPHVIAMSHLSPIKCVENGGFFTNSKGEHVLRACNYPVKQEVVPAANGKPSECKWSCGAKDSVPPTELIEIFKFADKSEAERFFEFWSCASAKLKDVGADRQFSFVDGKIRLAADSVVRASCVPKLGEGLSQKVLEQVSASGSGDKPPNSAEGR